MRWIFLLALCAALPAGCTLFGERPCEPGRYSCPTAEPDPTADLGGARACTLESPCPLPPLADSSPDDGAAALAALGGRGDEAWLVGSSGGQGVLLHAQRGQPTRQVATLPGATPRALAIVEGAPPTLLIASGGSALYRYAPQTAMLTTVSLETGGCQGRISPTGALSGVLALAAEDLWLVGAATSDAAAGLFRVRAGVCQVLPELASAGLAFHGVWGTLREQPEPAQRLIWTVGDSGAAVMWSFQGPDGLPLAQRFALPSPAPLRAVGGSARCPTGSPGACAFMITASALYSATDGAPQPVALPPALQAAELLGLFVDGDSVWLVGTLAGQGLLARYQPQTAAWSYRAGLRGGALRAAWGPGDGSLWLAGDSGSVLYLPNGS